MTATPGWASKNQTIQDQSEIVNNQIQLTELATYEERTPDHLGMHQQTLTKNRNRVKPARKENWKKPSAKKSFPFLELKCVFLLY